MTIPCVGEQQSKGAYACQTSSLVDGFGIGDHSEALTSRRNVLRLVTVQD